MEFIIELVFAIFVGVVVGIMAEGDIFDNL